MWLSWKGRGPRDGLRDMKQLLFHQLAPSLINRSSLWLSMYVVPPGLLQRLFHRAPCLWSASLHALPEKAWIRKYLFARTLAAQGGSLPCPQSKSSSAVFPFQVTSSLRARWTETPFKCPISLLVMQGWKEAGCSHPRLTGEWSKMQQVKKFWSYRSVKQNCSS